MEEQIVAWYSELHEIEEIAKKRGYRVKDGAPVLSIRKEVLLSSPLLKKALHIQSPKSNCLSFEELWGYQYDEIALFLKKRGIDRPSAWLTRFDPSLSQVVYDEKDKVRALLLSSTKDWEIFIELLLGSHHAAEHIMSALQGFVIALIQWKGEEKIITMVAAGGLVRNILVHMMGKNAEIQEIGRVRMIQDNILDEELLQACEKGKKESRIQENISWKVQWAEGTGRKLL